MDENTSENVKEDISEGLKEDITGDIQETNVEEEAQGMEVDDVVEGPVLIPQGPLIADDSVSTTNEVGETVDESVDHETVPENVEEQPDSPQRKSGRGRRGKASKATDDTVVEESSQESVEEPEAKPELVAEPAIEAMDENTSENVKEDISEGLKEDITGDIQETNVEEEAQGMEVDDVVEGPVLIPQGPLIADDSVSTTNEVGETVDESVDHETVPENVEEQPDSPQRKSGRGRRGKATIDSAESRQDSEEWVDKTSVKESETSDAVDIASPSEPDATSPTEESEEWVEGNAEADEAAEEEWVEQADPKEEDKEEWIESRVEEAEEDEISEKTIDTLEGVDEDGNFRGSPKPRPSGIRKRKASTKVDASASKSRWAADPLDQPPHETEGELSSERTTPVTEVQPENETHVGTEIQDEPVRESEAETETMVDEHSAEASSEEGSRDIVEEAVEDPEPVMKGRGRGRKAKKSRFEASEETSVESPEPVVEVPV
jgi:hypothetical protein